MPWQPDDIDDVLAALMRGRHHHPLDPVPLEHRRQLVDATQRPVAQLIGMGLRPHPPDDFGVQAGIPSELALHERGRGGLADHEHPLRRGGADGDEARRRTRRHEHDRENGPERKRVRPAGVLDRLHAFHREREIAATATSFGASSSVVL
jgi:hypothetical protein